MGPAGSRSSSRQPQAPIASSPGPCHGDRHQQERHAAATHDAVERERKMLGFAWFQLGPCAQTAALTPRLNAISAARLRVGCCSTAARSAGFSVTPGASQIRNASAFSASRIRSIA